MGILIAALVWAPVVARGAEAPAADAPPAASPNPHVTGWLNLILPGSGRLLLGEPMRGGVEAAASISFFALGYSLGKPDPFSLDGVPTALPEYGRNESRGTNRVSLTQPLYATMLQEVGLKSHMTFTYLSYREAANRAGQADKLDQSKTLDLFAAPFQLENLTDPLVYVPLLLVAGATILDYRDNRDRGLPVLPRFTPTTNFLYAFNYQVVQSVGSGAPEEMFYRGFLQRELHSVVDSPWFAVPLSAAAFAFSHQAGDGRITAGVAGAYLGWLVEHYAGRLSPGIALHFWGTVILGLETVFLSHEAQRTTPPAVLSLQIDY